MSVEVKREGQVRRFSFEEFEAACRAGDIPAHTLVRMEAVTGGQFMPAGALEFYQVLVDPEVQAYERQLQFLPPLVTAALVGVQIRLWVWAKYPGADTLVVDHFTNWAPAAMEAGAVWRLLTYGLLHLDFTHLALNLLFLGYAGWNLERAMGRVNLLTVFVFSVFCGGLLSMLMSPGRPSLGASGGDFGLVAASVVFGWKNEDRLPHFARKYFGWAVLPYLVYPLLLGLLSSGVDNWGHVGGLLGGGALATWLQPDSFERFRANNRRLRRAAGAATLLALGAVWMWGIRLVPLAAPTGEHGLEASAPAGWSEGWTFTEDRGYHSPIGTGTLTVATKIHSRPMTRQRATQALLDQIEARADAVELLEETGVTVDGWEGVDLTIGFTTAGQRNHMTALVIVRGAMVHHVTLHSPEGRHWRYAQLARKVFRETRLVTPPDLEAARWKTAQHPRSSQPALVHGRLAAMAGHPDEAGEQLLKAWELGRDSKRADAAASLLDLYADYGEGVSTDRLDALVEAHPDRVDVVVAGAAAYERAGRAEDARELLLRAWDDQPGNHVLRRALVARGVAAD